MTYQYIAESTLPEDTQTYVTREADSQLYEALLEGKLCYVFNSRISPAVNSLFPVADCTQVCSSRSVFFTQQQEEFKLYFICVLKFINHCVIKL